ncbi:hypothetical protein HanRHA438_Chr03g0125291 [Helianthus annuus]|uniref:Uncharacterized protein n=1 Tax=Helianthus annuus TaxID=4232 RepID=A0A9K3JGA2_HELAN|nr:hypothetical protein HanXRQr2_Chr03g0113361 [Helianthus annuus]KAJ0593220.1 hypothetical protein HanHA300_Chr03g0094601 [Helianthus annuus]KAJ0601042.1 hypothetical protein HanIR_Chr03g0123911 [Helianthus annuus]KAJ0768297.1 hypothetical protein HanLR1_Chr03g0099681 [Helianthus annuus]KAJ0774058.1 hypothetical protein HanOQP8_Chr03g0107321 [Helianthus annuus]
MKWSDHVNIRSHEYQIASNVEFESSHNTCCVYDETLSKMVVFKEILPFMKCLPIQKALTDQHKVFKSHVDRFWKKATYDDVNDIINSIVRIDNEDKEIIITEQLVREVLDFQMMIIRQQGFQKGWSKDVCLGWSKDVHKELARTEEDRVFRIHQR